MKRNILARKQRDDWRRQLGEAIRSPAELLELLNLAARDEPATSRFPMLVPRAFANRMEPGNRQDPLLLQVLPDQDESRSAPGFSDDPVGDMASKAGRGILHKYQGRVLLIATGACAVNCRYCFRQAFPYSTEHAGRDQWRAAVEHIASDDSIEEVILSGGDPLMLSTRRLTQLTEMLRDIGHIRFLRIHSRLPVVLPDRITDNLLDWLQSLPWPAVLVLHANHANELDDNVAAAVGRLRKIGVHVLNQAVLLARVNDSVSALAALMRRTFEIGALPYYLHLLDPVSGAQRFDTSEEHARQLVEGLRRQLSGYLVPRLVREVAGEPYKIPVL
ncbi:MAG TPA: EF-P beta-lysylation protein EpmB [Wenzhouxiangella sp.]|nr:EF-P beta-lysylation protein EpmB [Wenzhouxiangella sp.]